MIRAIGFKLFASGLNIFLFSPKRGMEERSLRWSGSWLERMRFRL